MFTIVVDFNRLHADNKRVVVADPEKPDERAIAANLTPGMRVLLIEPADFQVEAIVEPIERQSMGIWWYGAPDWSTRIDLYEG